MHAGLIGIGRVLFEIFVPHEYLLLSRYGAHYLGVEYQADMDVARKAIAERGMRLVRDIGHAIHTHPADAFGMSFEFYHGYFHDMDWPNLNGPIKPAKYWRDEHGLGLTGMKGYSLVVNDLDAAVDFFKSFVSGEVVYKEDRPAVAGRAVGLKVADAIMEIMTPTGDGALQKHLRQHNQGIRSTIFTTRSIDQTKKYFADKGIKLVPGDAPGALAIPPEANLGVIFEFTE
jgi:hypothetical protein